MVEPALAEVNALADFDAHWEIYRQRGRKVESVRFIVTKKGERERREFNGRAWKNLKGGAIALKAETYEAARRLVPGCDVHVIEAEWRGFINGKPKPRKADGAFLGFVKVWKKKRQGNLFD